MINCLGSQYDQEYIANVLWNRGIAYVSSITIVPYLNDNNVCSMVYIDIGEWCATEAAFNFIQSLKESPEGVLIPTDKEDFWMVQINTHNDGGIIAGNYTRIFNPDYFDEEEEEDDVTEPSTDDDDVTASCTDDSEPCQILI
jgi:hypothetical protein